ncbi:MAG: membrane protein insertion efficiency factor YidD [Myxococcota bacterium]
MKRILLALLWMYRRLLSPVLQGLGASCRFHPSCSVYAMAVIERHGAWRGTRLALARLARCHPGHPGGFDPPPEET